MTRQLLAVLGGTGLLAAALTGCTTLVDADPQRTPAPTAEAQPTPAAPKGTYEPLVPVPVLSTRTSDAKLESLASRLTKGGHPIDSFVPGTVDMVLEDRFTGPHDFDLPKAPEPGTSSIIMAVSCVPERSSVTVMTLDDEMNRYTMYSGTCGRELGMTSGGENEKETHIRVLVDEDVEVLLGVARGEKAPRS